VAVWLEHQTGRSGPPFAHKREMVHSELLHQLILVLCLAVGVVVVFSRLRQPSIVGLLVTGVLAGPSGLGIIADSASVQDLAEVGVVFLLFSIGLEMSLGDLFAMRRVALGAGLLQVVGTTLAGCFLARLSGLGPEASIVTGFVMALSSTAVVSRLLSDTGQIETPHGRDSMAILIFQDLCILPMTAILPVLAGGRLSVVTIGATLVKALVMVAVLVAVIRLVIPRLLRAIVRTRSAELFVLGTLLVCLGTAWAGASLGLSTALGAFLAGLAVASSPYSHHALVQVIPFRMAFNGIFFVTVGMLVDLRFIGGHLDTLAGLLLCVVVVKFVVATVSLAIAKESGRSSVATALCLSQIGEFSLVLVKMAQESAIFSVDQVRWTVAVAVANILITPLLVRLAVPLGNLAGRVLGDRQFQFPEDLTHRQGHVLIAGYGVNGQNVARVLKAVGIPYIVVELNGVTVQQWQVQGEEIHYGDVTSPATLEHLGILHARELVLAISDPTAARLTVKLAREMAPMLKIVVRTRFVQEIEHLYELGADLVVTDEMEASLRLVSVVLSTCDVASVVRQRLVDEIFTAHYGGLIACDVTEATRADDMRLGGMESRPIEVHAEDYAIGRSLGTLDLRKRTGATCLSIRRGVRLLASPGPDLAFEEGDVAVVFGDSPAVQRAERLLTKGLASLPGEPTMPRRRSSDRLDV